LSGTGRRQLALNVFIDRKDKVLRCDAEPGKLGSFLSRLFNLFLFKLQAPQERMVRRARLAFFQRLQPRLPDKRLVQFSRTGIGLAVPLAFTQRSC
jgi:hypothetical protein